MKEKAEAVETPEITEVLEIQEIDDKKEKKDKKNKKFKKGKKSKKKWIIIGVIALVIVVLLFVFMLSGKKGREDFMGKEQIQVTRRDITATITGTAVIKPKDQYAITALVNGEVLSADFQEGDYVSKGDVLYTIDSSTVENNIQSADIAIQKAQNAYNDALDSQKDTNVTADASGIIKKLYVKEGDNVPAGGQIADLYDDSVMELKIPFNADDASRIGVGSSAEISVVGSYDRLYGTVSSVNNASYAKQGNMLVTDVTIRVNNPGVLTQSDKATAVIDGIACNDAASFTYITDRTVCAKASGEVKRLNVKEGNRVSGGAVIAVLNSTSINSNVKSSELNIKDAKLGKDKAVRQLDDYIITAPISGKVITKTTKAGDKLDQTNKQTEMAVIYDMSSLKFEIMIDELDINKISVGQEVKITADALGGKEYTGFVEKVNIDGTEANGVTSYPVTVAILSFDEELLPGMNIDAEIAVGKAENVLAVPKSAVTRDNIAYVKGEKTDRLDSAPEGYRSVKVVTGLNDGNYIEIVSGLSENDVVKTETVNGSGNMMQKMMNASPHGGGAAGGGGAPGGGTSGGGAAK